MGLAPASERKYRAGVTVLGARNSNRYGPGSNAGVENLPVPSVMPLNTVEKPFFTTTCTLGAVLLAKLEEHKRRKVAETIPPIAVFTGGDGVLGTSRLAKL